MSDAVQQVGTHRVLVHMEWREQVSSSAEVEIDVPDGFDGEVSDLLDPDDAPDIEGAPAGYKTNWMERADAVMDSVDDREITNAYEVEPMPAQSIDPYDPIDPSDTSDPRNQLVDSITISMDGPNGVFYGGVAAGARASDELEELPKDATFAARSSYFWLKVGTILAKELPTTATEDQVALFIQGAGLRQPEETTPAFVLRIDSATGSAFGFTETDEEATIDEEKAVNEISRIITGVLSRLRQGYPEGPLFDSNGHTVGSFSTDLYA